MRIISNEIQQQARIRQTLTAANIMKELTPDAEFHRISLREAVFVSKLGPEQVPAILTETMVPVRNGRRSAAELLLMLFCCHNG